MPAQYPLNPIDISSCPTCLSIRIRTASSALAKFHCRTDCWHNGTNLSELPFPGQTYRESTVIDYCVEHNLSTPQPFDGSSLAPQLSLGILDLLPLELLQSTVTLLDLLSIEALSLANRRALQLVQSTPQYLALRRHAPDALRGARAILTGNSITCRQLYDRLCAAECEGCGQYGAFLYLLTCRRVCYHCIHGQREFQPLRMSHVRMLYNLDRKVISTLPQMKSIPGRYSENAYSLNQRVRLVDHRSALDAATAKHGSLEAARQGARTQAELDSGTAFVRRTVGRSIQTRRLIEEEDVCEGRVAEAFRFAAVVRAPVLMPGSDRVEWGFHCAGCRDIVRSDGRHFRTKYSEATFQRHLERHGIVEGGKHRPGLA